MSSYWDSYGTIPARRLCDICHCYGHWSYECNFTPRYPTSPYTTVWDQNFHEGYEDDRGEAREQNFQEWEFSQYCHNQQGPNEDSMHEKLDKMLSLLEDMKETRQGSVQRQEEFDQMSQFHAPTEEVEEDENGPDSQIQDGTKHDSLCLPPVVDEQYLEHEERSLNLPKQYPGPEPIKPFYTELEYVLEFDDFSEVDETELVRDHEEIDSTRENVEMDARGDGDEFNGVEMTDNETKEADICFQSVEKMSIIVPGIGLTDQKMSDIPLNQPTRASYTPKLMEQLEYHNLWRQDTINPSRKGWDVRLDGGPCLYQKVHDDLVGKSSQELVYWGFYHLPFKLKDPSGCLKGDGYAILQVRGEEELLALRVEDDRLDAPDIITWYKDRGKYFPQCLCSVHPKSSHGL